MEMLLAFWTFKSTWDTINTVPLIDSLQPSHFHRSQVRGHIANNRESRRELAIFFSLDKLLWCESVTWRSLKSAELGSRGIIRPLDSTDWNHDQHDACWWRMLHCGECRFLDLEWIFLLSDDVVAVQCPISDRLKTLHMTVHTCRCSPPLEEILLTCVGWTSCSNTCSDYRGGFHLQPVQDTLQGRQLIEELERLRLSSRQSGLLPLSRAFTPLLDVPVDDYTSRTIRSRSPSPSTTRSSILSESPRSTQQVQQPYRSPNRGENGALRYDEVSLLTVSDRGDVAPERGRSPVRNGRSRRDASPDSMEGRLSSQEGYTEVSVRVPSQRRLRTPLTDVFELQRDKSPSIASGSSQQLNGISQNGVKGRTTLQAEEYKINTFTISKSRPSLGESNTYRDTCELCAPLFKFKL